MKFHLSGICVLFAVGGFSAAAQSMKIEPLPIVLPKSPFEGTPERRPCAKAGDRSGVPHISWYAQDNWKVRPHLTLNLGVRFSWYQPPYDNKGPASFFNPGLFDPSNGAGQTGSAIFNNFTSLTVTNNLRPAGSTSVLGTYFGEDNAARDTRVVQVAGKLYS
jgi:hypothetical protein